MQMAAGDMQHAIACPTGFVDISSSLTITRTIQ